MNKATQHIIRAWWATGSPHLSIETAKLEEIALANAKNEFKIPNWRFPGVYPNHELAYAATQLLANCFNFCFNVFSGPGTKYTVANPADLSKPFTGVFAMYRKIYERFSESIPQSSDVFCEFGKIARVKKFFKGVNDIPFPELRYECAINFAEGLDEYDGNPLNLLEDAMVWDENSQRSVLRAFNGGKGLIELLTEKFRVAYGDDVQPAEVLGERLAFNKRAQLVTILLHGRALDSRGTLPLVVDIDEVGPIADYEVPKALRALGILRYSDELAELVDNWKEIPKDSRMEVETREATVTACMMLMCATNSHRKKHKLEPINICHLDYWLWKMGKDAKHLRPHLTRTSAY